MQNGRVGASLVPIYPTVTYFESDLRMCATVFAENEWRATKQLLLYPSKFATGEEPCGEKEDQSDELAHHNHQSKRQGRLSDIVLQAATRFTATVGFRVTKKGSERRRTSIQPT